MTSRVVDKCLSLLMQALVQALLFLKKLFADAVASSSVSFSGDLFISCLLSHRRAIVVQYETNCKHDLVGCGEI